MTKDGTGHDSSTLRQIMNESLKYIRLCTLDLNEFCNEVCSTKILTNEEVVLIIESITKKTTVDNLTTVCNTIERRNLTSRNCNKVDFVIDIPIISKETASSYETHLYITTHSSPMYLVAATFHSRTCNVFRCCDSTPKELRFPCVIKISLDRLYDYRTNYNVAEPPVELVFNENLSFGKEFEVMFPNGGNYLNLLSLSKYKLSVTFLTNNHIIKYYITSKTNFVSNNNRIEIGIHKGYCMSAVKKLKYSC